MVEGHTPVNVREIAREISKSMRCNCDFDNWEPTSLTGHSWVCRIHKAAVAFEKAAPGLRGGDHG